MNFQIFAAGLVGAAMLVTPALGDEAVMTRPIQAASLHDGPLDMVSYWVPLEDDGYELTATFRERHPEAQPMRIVMKLVDGDSVAFGMPGHKGVLYRFERIGTAVHTSADVLPARVAIR